MGARPWLARLLVTWAVGDGVANDDGVALIGVLVVSFFFSASRCRSLESRRWRSQIYNDQLSGQSYE